VTQLPLENWLIARRTVKAIGLVLEHSKMTTVSVELLVKCAQNAIDGKKEDLQSNFELLHRKEEEADTLRRRIIEELARGELPADERVGLMRLGRQIDWIADWSHEAARDLLLFDLSTVPKRVQEIIVETCETVRECTAKVGECVENLMDGEIDRSLQAADGVERLEEKADDLYQRSRAHLKDMDAGRIGVGSMILLGEFLGAIENTADRCEDSCDQVRVMAVMLARRKE
jgi:predicted phosphate transport protein (TIGR00153 family)